MSCAEAVLKYMVAQNRPYSATDVTMNLGNQHSKGSVQKALEQLAQQGRLLEKEYGKQKVYCALQSGGASKETLAKELQELDAGIAAAQQNLNAVEQQLRESEAVYKELSSGPTTEEAEAESAALDARLHRLRSKLADLADNCVKISPEDRHRIARQHETMLREYRKRKRICNEMVNEILEGYDKSKKTLLEELGVETDEDAGVKL